MGQYFKIVNQTKKQFIDIDGLGENNKFGFIGQGLNGIALGRLLTSHGDSNGEWSKYYGDPEKDDFFVGAWVGDQIIIAGDEDLPNSNGIQTSENDSLNLYDKAEFEYTNVTNQIIDWLAKDDDLCDELAERAKLDSSFLSKLIVLIEQTQNKPLAESLSRIVGKSWNQK